MSAPQIAFAYPTAWPHARARTPGSQRKTALWRNQGSRVSFDGALGRLREQVALVTRPGRPWRMTELTLSTNYELRADGRPRRDRRAPPDPAVAFFFELDGSPHLLACDRWDTIADNIAAIAAHIEALRGQERWGVADLKQAFAGHARLAAPTAAAPETWWQILGCKPDATPDQVSAAWRDKMREAHPDRGGSNEAAARLNRAREEGLHRG